MAFSEAALFGVGPFRLEGPDPVFFFPLLVIPGEVAGPIAGEAPPGVHLLNSQGTGHLDLQNWIIRYHLLEVTGDVQTLVFLRRFNLMGVTVLVR